jgi:CDP-paratose 2-epimerase
MSEILITGGAGFIGTNLAFRLLACGHTVCILDNLSRQNVVRNLSTLTDIGNDRLRTEIADIRDRSALRRAVRNADHVFHLAAQVAVTSSVEDPMTDFEINVRGTLQLLEEIRSAPEPPSLIYTSTNKVYGSLSHIPLKVLGKRYVRTDGDNDGIDEKESLSFHSPYGCSKGAAEQYVLDYCRTYGIAAAVFRMSCIYGPYQFGTEDQGWVAHIMARALARQAITIYGDGCQVRDLLFVDDLVNAFILAKDHMAEVAGEAFNIGGGPENTVSLLDFIEIVEQFQPRPALHFSPWRMGDQKYYVSDTRKFQNFTGWTPQTDIRTGFEALHHWLVTGNRASAQLVSQAS